MAACLSLQLDELIGGVDTERQLIVRDYMPTGRRTRSTEEVLAEIATLDSSVLVDLGTVAAALRIGSSEALDSPLAPRGYRLLARVPRMPAPVVDRLVEHFGSLQKLLAATVEDLQAVEGVGDLRARGVREGLSRLAESSILERYV